MEEKCTYSVDKKRCNCILHYKEINKSIQIFNEAIDELIKINKNKKPLELNDIIFPNDFEYNIIFKSCSNIQFHNCEFNSTPYDIDVSSSFQYSYYDCQFNKKWLHLNIKTINYSTCHFKDDIWLFNEKNASKTDNIHNLHFDYCVFEEEFNLDFSADNMPKCNIHTLNIQNSIFKKSLRINKCQIEPLFMFASNSVLSISEFENNIFRGSHFVNNKFSNTVSFNESHFHKFSFQKNSFDRLVIFQNTIFNQKINLVSNIFKDEINFLNIKNKDGNKLESENISNRETARIIKHSFEKIDNIIEANRFYALEMEKRKEELSNDIEKGKNIFEYFIFHIHKFSSNHSTNPLLVLFWILIISLFYSYSGDFLEKQDFYIDCFESKYLDSWIYSFYNTRELFDFFFVILTIFSVYLLSVLICSFKETGLMIIFTICFISFYIFLTKDFYLFLVAKNFNPFSIMTKGEDLTFSMLIYKSSMAYLIYQFIISIRQNTRRK